MALPALVPAGATIAIVAERPDPDGRGLAVAFTAAAPGGRRAAISPPAGSATPGRPRESRDLVGLTLDGEPLGEARLFVLVRYWLGTPEGRAADPAPLGDSRRAVAAKAAAYALQMARRRPAARRRLRSARRRLFADLRPDRADQLRLRRACRGGRLWRGDDALALAGPPPAPLLAAAFVMAGAVALGWGFATARCVFIPLRLARGQQTLVATVGLAIFLQELLRIAQGDRTSWMRPMLNQPFALARSPAISSPSPAR